MTLLLVFLFISGVLNILFLAFVVWLYFHSSPTPEYLTLKITQLENRLGELESENSQLKEAIKQKDKAHKDEVNQLFYYIGELTIKINQLNNGQSPTPIPGRVTESQEQKLRRLIIDSFNLEEFKLILGDSSIPVSELDDKKPFPNYVQDALDYCQRRFITLNLIEVLKKERPHIDWYGTK